MEAIQKNIIAIKDHSEETRKLLREMQKDVETLKNQLATAEQLRVENQRQLAILQAKVLGGRATA